MNLVNPQPFRPFISIMLIVMTLFGIVFLQMEERRLGYAMLKQRREHKMILDEKRTREIQLAKITRPQLLESMAASHFTLKKLQSSQIIHLSGGEGMKTAKATETRKEM